MPHKFCFFGNKKYPGGFVLGFYIKKDGLQVTVCWAPIKSRSKYLEKPTWRSRILETPCFLFAERYETVSGMMISNGRVFVMTDGDGIISGEIKS